jgi:hypothetical protein
MSISATAGAVGAIDSGGGASLIGVCSGDEIGNEDCDRRRRHLRGFWPLSGIGPGSGAATGCVGGGGLSEIRADCSIIGAVLGLIISSETTGLGDEITGDGSCPLSDIGADC